VRVKVDENLPGSAARVLRAAGHDADTVQEEGLAGATDPDVMKAAVADRRMVFTLDRGFGDLARTIGAHAGVVVFRLPKQDARSAAEVVARFVAQFDLDGLGGCTVIVQPDRVRIRRPD
jgi:predicted nuclease of predicted toxin-antitoxin system